MTVAIFCSGRPQRMPPLVEPVMVTFLIVMFFQIGVVAVMSAERLQACPRRRIDRGTHQLLLVEEADRDFRGQRPLQESDIGRRGRGRRGLGRGGRRCRRLVARGQQDPAHTQEERAPAHSLS